MKSPTLKTWYVGGVFQFDPLFVLLTFQVIYQGQGRHEGNWTWHDLRNLLIDNLNDKHFYKSIDWSALVPEVYSNGWMKISDLQC